MFSGFKNVDPHMQGFPHLREHHAYPYNSYSDWETPPTHWRMDSMKHPSPCGSGIYKGHPEHNCSCDHGCAPCYPGFGYPYCHFQHPMYYPGPYPPYPNAYPPFFIPPHYSSNAGFDYGKTSHCCNCPNHTCHVKDGSNLKIEEQPNSVPKESQSSLIQLPGYPYPIISLPNYRVNDCEMDPKSGAHPESHKGWFPLSYHKGLSQGGNGNYFQGPYQIIHAPPGNEKADEHVKDLKEINDVSRSDEAWPSNFRIVPLKLLENGNHGEIPEVCKESKNQQAVASIADKERSLKTIPVKKVEGENEGKIVMLEKPSGEKDPKNPTLVEIQESCKDKSTMNDSAPRVADKERTLKIIPVKQLEGGDEDKAIMSEKLSEENKLKNSNSEGKRKIVSTKKDSGQKQSSPTVKSKLPPICLRVEPLLKKNGTNGKVRSAEATTRTEKTKSQEDNTEQVSTMKEFAENNHNEIDVKTSKPSIEGSEKVQTFDSRECVVSVGEECASNNKKDDVSAFDIEMRSTVDVSKEDEANDNSGHLKQETEQNKGEADTSDYQKNKEEEVRRIWLEEDAALIIQSAFRGYSVRRWKPLEKLRKIADIRDKMVDVRKQLYELESSSGRDRKQKDIIGETIMNLLLQLDSIQGLHPSLREIRKLVARELVHLQEQVDQLSNQATNGQQETQKDDKIASPDDAATVMCSIPVAETVCSAADRPVNENSVAEQSSFSIAGEYTSDLKLSTSSETSRCVPEVDENEPVLRMVEPTLTDEPVIIEYNQGRQEEDENESQIVNLATEGTAGELGKQEVVRPSAGEILVGILPQQHEAEQLRAFKETSVEVELDKNVNSDTVHEEPSISFSKEFKLDAGIVVETDEEKKQNSTEGTTLEYGEACDVKESASIQLEEVNAGEVILENTSIAKDV
ncbi:hypothetical protein HPP92_008605 [Vanilla planifolia]|uniref:BAG domain-containing protein n=1 Tax=Vanilla planifolia TaxID=51239 RepID=A0A835REC5_VANPL|nr:hypothetical protein HPP92_008605 [Vanilla planifolia]